MRISRLSGLLKKSAIFPSISDSLSKGRLSSREGLFFAAIVLFIIIPVYFFGVFSAFDDALNAIVLQFNYSLNLENVKTSPHLFIAKKDERTSRLIGRNPGREEFASIFRFLGREKIKEFSKQSRTENVPLINFKLGQFDYEKFGFIQWSLNKLVSIFNFLDNPNKNSASMASTELKHISSFVNYKFEERLFDFFTRFLGCGLAESNAQAIVQAWSYMLRAWLYPNSEIDIHLDEFWIFTLIDLIRANLELEVTFAPKAGRPQLVFQISLKARKKERNSYVIPPARVIAFDFLLDGAKSPQEDFLLSEAIRTSSAPVVLAASLRSEELTQQSEQKINQGPFGLGQMVASTSIVIKPTYPPEIFATGSARIGFINVVSGNKGYVSKLPLFVSLADGSLEPSFCLITAAIALDREKNLTGSESYEFAMREELRRIQSLKKTGTYRGGFQMKDIDIPTDSNGIMNINFFGTTKTPAIAPFIQSADFYECFDELHLASTAARIPSSADELDPEKVHLKTAAYNRNIGNRICFVGPFELSDFDYFPTPFTYPSPWQKQSQMLMGIEIHANAVQTILSRAFIKDSNVPFVIFLLIISTLLLGIVFDLISPVLGVFVMVGMCLAVAGFAVMSFRWGYYFHFSPFLVTFPLTWALTNISHYIKQREKARGTKEMFGRFVSPEVVDYLIQNPQEVKPGGQKVELTIFFSDLAGFTTISESLPPEELVVMMNEYLGAMTELLFKHGGTLDKYIGDAVMAYWNFPKKQDDHAVRALLYTLEMHEKLKELQADWLKRGLPRAYARAGINTANVVVGCIGSKTQMNFTCLGDGVNLASRLEGANKEYGTLYMCSDATYQRAKDRIRCRFLDFLAVKGKKEPVKVYEIVSEIGCEPPWFIDIGKKYEEAIQLHLSRKWDDAITIFEEILAKYPDDGPSKTYLKRCHEYKQSPPPEEWDGSYHLTHK